MVEMICPICRDDCSMEVIICVTCSTACAPACASAVLRSLSCTISWAVWADCWMVEAISSMDAAVSSKLLACKAVRSARFSALA